MLSDIAPHSGTLRPDSRTPNIARGLGSNLAEVGVEPDPLTLGLSLQRGANVIVEADRNRRGHSGCPCLKALCIIAYDVVHRREDVASPILCASAVNPAFLLTNHAACC